MAGDLFGPVGVDVQGGYPGEEGLYVAPSSFGVPDGLDIRGNPSACGPLDDGAHDRGRDDPASGGHYAQPPEDRTVNWANLPSSLAYNVMQPGFEYDLPYAMFSGHSEGGEPAGANIDVPAGGSGPGAGRP